VVKQRKIAAVLLAKITIAGIQLASVAKIADDVKIVANAKYAKHAVRA
jgi:hypothetical protein